MPSTAIDGRPLKTSFDFMEKAFEMQSGGNYMNGWIKYDPDKDMLVPVLIEPELIHNIFKNFRMQLRPKEPKKQSWLQPIELLLKTPAGAIA